MVQQRTSLAVLRFYLNLSQVDLAKQVGTSRSAISLIERRLLRPSPGLQVRLAEALGADLRQLRAAQGWQG